AEDEDFPSWGPSRRSATLGGDDAPGGEFTWPPKPRTLPGGRGRVSLGNQGGSGSGAGLGGGGNPGGSRVVGPSGILGGVETQGRPFGGRDGLAGSSNGAGRLPAGPTGSRGNG